MLESAKSQSYAHTRRYAERVLASDSGNVPIVWS